MGFQTNISILNDHWHEIREDPEKFVEGINLTMHDGTNSLVSEFFDHEYFERHGTFRPEYAEQAWLRRNYVTVHKSQHADVPQVTYTHGNSSFDVYDFQRGVELGTLDLKSNPETWVKIGREMAKELRRQAKALDRALNDWEKEAENA